MRSGRGKLTTGLALVTVGWVLGPVVAAAVQAASPWADDAPTRAVRLYESEGFDFLPARESHQYFVDQQPAQTCGYRYSEDFTPEAIIADRDLMNFGYHRLIDTSKRVDRFSVEVLQAWQLASSAAEFELGFLANCMQYTVFASVCRRRISYHLGRESKLKSNIENLRSMERATSNYVMCRYLDGVVYRNGIRGARASTLPKKSQ